VLSNRATEERVNRVVRVAALGWLILQASVDVLAAEQRIALYSLLIAEPVSVQVTLAAHCDIQQLERCSLPEVIAAVDKLVHSAVEASLACNLPLNQPV